MAYTVNKDVYITTKATGGTRIGIIKRVNGNGTYNVSWETPSGPWKLERNVPESALSER